MPVRAYGKYFLVRKLAEGGMAEIFLAKQVGEAGFERNVVVKRMLPHLSTVPDFVSMFLDEARLAASLAHPNIVHITDLGLADGCYFICMEYLPGEDFSTVVRTAKRRNSQVPLHVVLRVVAQAATGLHFAHHAADPSGKPMNLVHRDISPSNLFVTYSGQVKVLDFGIAKAESRVTNTTAGVVKGKYQYMSPEQARGDAIDRRADVFSLGVTTYEALTGVRPFARDTDLAILKAVLSGDCQPIRQLRPDLPPEVEAIVRKMMAVDPDARYGSALEVVQDIERFLSATTSASGGQLLADFMTSFFGPDRVNSRSRIETLEQLAARGVEVPGRSNPLTKRTDPGTLPAATIAALPPDEQTKAIEPPSTVQGRGGGRRGGVLVAAVVGALLVGVGVTVGVLKGLRPGGAPVALPAAPDAAVAEAEVDAGPPAVEDAGSALAVAAEVDAGAEEPAVPAKGAKPAKPVVLTTALVSKGVSGAKGRIQRCFRDHRDELPSAQGTLKLQFTIASSGKVTAASTDLPGTKVSKCIEAAVRALSFPRHVDLEVRVPIALAWDVR
ncbi:MAG: serine/threonine protein kinase [Myxococcales bacterium]|nr:serine/threonine protein kinase [Myxococcales bacterium]